MRSENNNTRQVLIAIIIITLASLTRFMPHPFNFTAVGAMALFSGAVIRDKRYAFLLPVIVMFMTDLFIGFHFSILPVYGCFAFTVWLGTKIKKKKTLLPIAAASLTSSVIFFLVTNLPFWYLDLKLYPMTFSGTIQSYEMAIPFFKNQVLGDLLYNALLFGIYSIVNRKNLILKPNTIKK